MAAFTSGEMARLWRDRQGRFSRVLDRATEELRKSVESTSRQAMQSLIYSKPEDVAPSGRKRWIRTGDLKSHEKAVMDGRGVVRLTNDLVYAKPRHEAGKPGARKINPARIAHWREVIRMPIREAQLRIYEQRLLSLWRQS